jgi:hypothetical protein
VPRCGALRLQHKPLHYKGGGGVIVVLRPLIAVGRGAQADARGATRVLDRGVQAVARGAARCALHVHGRGARVYACGVSFAVLSSQVLTVGLRMRLVVPGPMPVAAASRCCQRRFQQLACACGTAGWRVAACLK